MHAQQFPHVPGLARVAGRIHGLGVPAWCGRPHGGPGVKVVFLPERSGSLDLFEHIVLPLLTGLLTAYVSSILGRFNQGTGLT
jgi:hypothetical protein